MILQNLRAHLPFVIFFISFFITGLVVCPDYGISWDEAVQRGDNGTVNYNYIRTGDRQELMNGNEKYHGPAFEILLVTIEKVSGFEDLKDIYLLRHYITFITFAISVLFFYLLCLKNFNRMIALTGAIFLVLSPRIFADAFYNSKDLVFMSVIIINMYTLQVFYQSKKTGAAIFHGIITALVIDVRIMGVIMPAITYLILLMDFFRNPLIRKKIIFSTGIYSVVLIAFMILCWPVLWHDPIGNFMNAIGEMSKYHWDGFMRYLGKEVNAQNLPWHYIPVWIGVTTPLLYTLLFVTGLYFLIKKILANLIHAFDFLRSIHFLFSAHRNHCSSFRCV